MKKRIITTQGAQVNTNAPQSDQETRNLCALWTFRAIAHRMCNGNPASPYKVLFDACNDMIGATSFSQFDFMACASRFGINPNEIFKVDNQSIITDNLFSQARTSTNGILH